VTVRVSSTPQIEGQLSDTERRLLTETVLHAREKPRVVLEVGTWLGGGSTLHILRALQQNGIGHLWGIESDRTIYNRMVANIRAATPEAADRFTPLLGFSRDIIPQWLAGQGPDFRVDFVFLDGGDNPGEQVLEFQLLDPFIPVNGQIMAHDAKVRKGKWLVPYLSALDHWQVRLHDSSEVGLLTGRKIAARPSAASLRAARAKLFNLRCNPVEIAGAILPARICGLIIRSLPQSVRQWLYAGRA
jgi:predicted O-methyltransferase YrrM